MPRALANRLLHIEIIPDFDSWSQWTVAKGINPKVVGFVSFNQNYLNQDDATKDDVAYPTPRTWEMVSNILNNVSEDMNFVYPLISGLVGVGMATEFRAWCKIYKDLPNIEDIFAGKETKLPKGTDRLYALISAMLGYAKQHKLTAKKLENSLEYAMQMTPDFTCVLIKGYQNVSKDFSTMLLQSSAYLKWINTKGRFLNGIVR